MPHTPNEPIPVHKKPNKYDKFYSKCDRRFRVARAREQKDKREKQKKESK